MSGRLGYWANIWYCSANPGGAPGHPYGIGAKPHRYCECGATIFTDRGRWGAFTADATGQPTGKPLADYRLRTAAVTWASDHGPGLVVGWIPEDDLDPAAPEHPGSPKFLGAGVQVPAVVA